VVAWNYTHNKTGWTQPVCLSSTATLHDAMPHTQFKTLMERGSTHRQGTEIYTQIPRKSRLSAGDASATKAAIIWRSVTGQSKVA